MQLDSICYNDLGTHASPVLVCVLLRDASVFVNVRVYVHGCMDDVNFAVAIKPLVGSV